MIYWLAIITVVGTSHPSTPALSTPLTLARCDVYPPSSVAWAWTPAGNSGDGLPWWAVDWRPGHLQVTPKTDPAPPTELLDSARNHLGTPYVWGGTGKSGYDCSGFVNAVYAEHGYDLPRVSRDQFRVGVKTERDHLAPGDLLFFVKEPGEKRISHVAMFVGDDEFIHAAYGKGEVTYDRLTSNYYNTRFVGARRFLTLPPGRYSNTAGRAAKNLLFDNQLDAGKVRPTAVDPLLLELGLSQSGDMPREHEPEDRPLQLASGFKKGPVSKVGPRLLAPDETSVGFGVGAGKMDDTGVVMMVPGFTYFGHDNALRVNIGFPFQIPFSGSDESVGEVFTQGWDEFKDYSKVIRDLRFGQKESNLYIELSRTASGSLGHGQLMRYFTPNMASRYLPDYPLNPDALSGSFDAYAGFGGFELFVDDVIAPKVMGALLFGRPSVIAGSDSDILRPLSLGLTYVIDHEAPYERLDDGTLSTKAIHGAGLDAEYKFYKSDTLDVKAYADVSGLLYDGGAGAGGAVGALLRANLGNRRNHVLRWRVEGRLSSPTFIPSYFDTSYGLDRHRAPVVDLDQDNPLTKLALLEELNGTAARWGMYGEAVYHYRKKLTVALSYEDGDSFGTLPASERFIGRNLMAVVHIRDLYLPRSTKSIEFYLAYHMRNFRWTAIDDTHQYLFAAGSLRLSRYIDITASLRKAVDEKASTEASIDGVVGVTARYEL